MSKEIVDTHQPTAISTKLVLSLIANHVAGDNQAFKEKALDVADELRLMGRHELADYILAQYKMIRTFEVTD